MRELKKKICINITLIRIFELPVMSQARGINGYGIIRKCHPFCTQAQHRHNPLIFSAMQKLCFQSAKTVLLSGKTTAFGG